MNIPNIKKQAQEKPSFILPVLPNLVPDFPQIKIIKLIPPEEPSKK